MERKTMDGQLDTTPYDVSIDAGIMASNTTFRALVSSLSGSGMEMLADKSIDPKKKVLISIRLQEEFVFHGTVLWTLSDFVGQKWVYRIGGGY